MGLCEGTMVEDFVVYELDSGRTAQFDMLWKNFQVSRLPLPFLTLAVCSEVPATPSPRFYNLL